MIKYRNGNYLVVLKEDGTKLHLLDKGETEFKPDRVETLDICVSTECFAGCKFCYENCNKKGETIDMYNEKSVWFIENFVEHIPEGTEITLNINDWDKIEYTYLNSIGRFLRLCKKNNLICNVTIRQKEFHKKSYNYFLKYWKKKGLIYGIGISLSRPISQTFLKRIKNKVWNNDIVIHTINGITPLEEYLKLEHCKVLVLGYKNLGRGKNYSCYNDKLSKELSDNLDKVSEVVDVLSFDNLALQQLDIKNKIDSDYFDTHFMGKDGTISMFIDLVNRTYAESSLVPKEERKPMLNKNVAEMYEDIRNNRQK